MMRLRKICLVAISCTAVFAVKAEQLMKNPDFEGGVNGGKATGWNYDGKKSSAGYGFGRNFSHGIIAIP
jgi:hypothetical protein